MVNPSCNPEDYPVFCKLPGNIIAEKDTKLKEWMNLSYSKESYLPSYVSKLNENEDKSKPFRSDECILNIIDLVERRRVYLHVFHDLNMSEWNEMALYCFWIIKLHPYYHCCSHNLKKTANELNAIIAMRLFIQVLNRIRKSKGKKKIGQLRIKNIIHTFRYRDISKEAIMTIFDVLIEE
jgi:hypothetical protein